MIIFIRPKFRLLKFAPSSVSRKLCFASICFCPQATLYFAYRLRHPHIVAVLRFVAYSGSFHFTLRKFRLLKILKLQLPLASYRSRSLRFRISLFHKSEFSQKKRDIFSVPNNSECKRKMFYYPSCFKVSKVSVLGICVILNWFFKEKV